MLGRNVRRAALLGIAQPRCLVTKRVFDPIDQNDPQYSGNSTVAASPTRPATGTVHIHYVWLWRGSGERSPGSAATGFWRNRIKGRF